MLRIVSREDLSLPLTFNVKVGNVIVLILIHLDFVVNDAGNEYIVHHSNTNECTNSIAMLLIPIGSVEYISPHLRVHRRVENSR